MHKTSRVTSLICILCWCSNLKTYILNIFFYFYHHLQFNLNKNTVVWGHICVCLFDLTSLLSLHTNQWGENHCKRPQHLHHHLLHQSLYNNSTNNLLNEAEIVLKSSEFCVDVHRFCSFFLSLVQTSVSFIQSPATLSPAGMFHEFRRRGGGVPMECTMCSCDGRFGLIYLTVTVLQYTFSVFCDVSLS